MKLAWGVLALAAFAWAFFSPGHATQNSTLMRVGYFPNLTHAQALVGEVDRARKTFTRAIEYANDVGLLAEEVESVSGELLGNFPQAFSHIGLVNAAWAIARGGREPS